MSPSRLEEEGGGGGAGSAVVIKRRNTGKADGSEVSFAPPVVFHPSLSSSSLFRGRETASSHHSEYGSFDFNSASSLLFAATSRAGRSSVRQTRLFTGGAAAGQSAVAAPSPSAAESDADRDPKGSSPSSRTTGTSRTRFTRLSSVRPRQHNRRQGRATAARRRQGEEEEMLEGATHVVCAVSENLARETCVTVIDTHAPRSTFAAYKQGNGQSYAETLACLQAIRPHEVLLNEGRKTSQLVRKVLELYGQGGPDNVPVDWMMSEQHQQKKPSQRGRKRQWNREDASRGTHRNVDTSGSNPPVDRAESCRKTVVKFVSRGLFDQTRGAVALRQLARTDSYDPTLVEEYILLSSANAVLSYSQMAVGASFAPHSLQLSLSAGCAGDGGASPSSPRSPRMMIDRTTLWQLELLVNSKSGKAHPSLMSTIDRTKTTVGSRLLRTNLMAPPTRIETIEARLELVDSFLRSSEFFFDVYEHLENLPDVDKMLSNITLVSRAVGLGGGVGGAGLREEQPSEQLVRLASKGIASLVSVKAVLSSTPYLAAALQAQLDALDRESGTTTPQPNHQRGVNDDEDGTVARSSLLVGLGAATATDSRNSSTTSSRDKNHLLRAIVSVLQQPQLSYVLKLITDIYTESTTHARNANARQHQECFALRDDSETGLLTVLRRSYKENVDDIYKAADALAEQHNLHVTVRYSAARGYYLSVPANSVGDLPGVFLHPTRSGRSINFETQLVASLNARAMDNVRDLLMITHERIERVLEKAREPACYDSLAALCDAIALLDLCHSYADVVSLSKLPWCRPLVFDYASRHNAVGDSSGQNPTALNGGGMIIRNGRFPIDVASPSAAESEADGPSLHFIPNDTYVPAGTSFTVISGVNGAGKSTYLKQVAVIAVLAHIGCYVPAEQASIPLFDRLCTRIGNADDQEHNISTFMLEMKETAFICTNASRNSLILLDELGRATSNEDGVAIAWAVSEYLLTRQSTVFFVTHYPQLTKLAEVYPGVVQNIHLEAHLNPGATVNQQLSYTHKVKAGWCSVSSEYGVELAAYCGWTQDVIDQARAYERQVRSLLPEDVSYQDHVTSACSRAFNSVSELVQGLKRLSRSNHSWSTLQNTLDDMQHSFYRSFRDDPEAEAVIRGLLQIAPSSVSSRSPTSSLFDKAGVEKDSRSIHEDHQENQRAEDWSQSGCEEPSLLLSPKADDAGSYASASSSCSSSTCTSARDDSSNSSSSASSGEARSSQAFGGDNRFRKTSRTTVFGKSVDP